MTAATPPKRSILLLVTRDGLGHADPALRENLLRIYLTLLCDNDMLPGAIAFMTDGVKLVIENSPVLEVLKKLEAKGVHLIICKTCLDYFRLTDRVAVGIVGGMPDIIAAQWAADKVITI